MFRCKCQVTKLVEKYSQRADCFVLKSHKQTFETLVQRLPNFNNARVSIHCQWQVYQSVMWAVCFQHNTSATFPIYSWNESR